ncbi:MAG TPA: phospholipase A [Polyangiaceae bacterium]
MAHSHFGARDRFSTRTARRRRNAARGAGFSALLSFLQLASPGRAQAASVEESGIDLLTFHRTNYFVTGFTDDTQVKFQFSFKYDLWPNRSRHNVYFAYTQKSLWDLYSRSSPFRESNYNPQVFYSHRHVGADRAHPGCSLVAEQAGFDHESNGEDGNQSRSWNRVFAAGSAACVDDRGRFIGWGVQVWLPFGLRDNDDITDYAGFGEFHLRTGVMDSERWWGSGELMLAGRKGTNTHGSLLAELSWRLGYRGAFGRAVRFAPLLFVQLFTGQGETLLRYDQTDRSVRLGIALRDRALLHE